MVLGETLFGAFEGVHSLFDYNRENFKYDREMRFKQEMQILNFRNQQAALWRDDIKDIIGMTEKKMDSYLIIATLQLGMCVGLFSEGRLEPGTPPFLMHFYMMTLGTAFMYLFMSAWFAMHASVVANCSSVRLLTQFVRLPIPTWESIHDQRTYASSFESVQLSHMFRVPFNGSAGSVKHIRGEAPPMETTSTTNSTAQADKASWSQSRGKRSAADPWGLEHHGDFRDLYELQEQPADLRHHIGLARRATEQFQCYDAFARVAMTFGTNQFLNAMCYYSLGYLAIQDGAVWPAWCVIVIMMCIALTLVNLDFSLSFREKTLAQFLIIVGPLCSGMATTAWTYRQEKSESFCMSVLPCAYASHGLWLLWALRALGMEKQPNGVMLPTKFRAVLYLDVFGWLKNVQPEFRRGASDYDVSAGHGGEDEAPAISCGEDGQQIYESLARLRGELRTDVARWQLDRIQKANSASAKSHVDQLTERVTALEAFLDEVPEAGQRRKDHPRIESGAIEGRMSLLSSCSAAVVAKSAGSSSPADVSAGESSRARLEARPSRSDSSSSGMVEPEEEDTPKLGYNGGISSKRFMEAEAQAARPMARVFTVLIDDEHGYSPSGKSHEHDEAHGYLFGAVLREPKSSSITGPASTQTILATPHEAHVRGVFTASTYLPIPVDDMHLSEAPCGEEERHIVTGHDRMQPGKLPSKVFHLATALVVCLWAVGLVLPLPMFRHLLTEALVNNRPVQEKSPERFSEMMPDIIVDLNGIPLLMPERGIEKDMPMMPQSEMIEVDWPHHFGFIPLALSTDPSGTQLIVADDLGLYKADITERVPPEASSTSESPRSLRSTEADSSRLIARFQRMPPCKALEGQALRDIGVVCTTMAGLASSGNSSMCRVLVLHAQGSRLSECPLEPGDILTSRHNSAWTISHDWLHMSGQLGHRERVESVAVSSDCLHAGNRSSTCTFEADDIGCVVVGTSYGRIVQLRGEVNDVHRLVPERAIHQRKASIHHGSLQIFPDGTVVALRRQAFSTERATRKAQQAMGRSSMQAFDTVQGNLIGEWRLPKELDWVTLTGGGQVIFALGLRDGKRVELHRFHMPTALTGQQAAARRRLWEERRLALDDEEEDDDEDEEGL